MSQDNLQAARSLYKAFNNGDLAAFERGCAPSLNWNEPENSIYAGGNPYRSFAAVRDQVFGPIARDYENFRCDLDQLLDAGDYVVGTGRYRGKNKETGKETSAQFCHLIHFDRNGRLDATQLYTDTLQENEVAGRLAVRQETRIPQPAM